MFRTPDDASVTSVSPLENRFAFASDRSAAMRSVASSGCVHADWHHAVALGLATANGSKVSTTAVVGIACGLTGRAIDRFSPGSTHIADRGSAKTRPRRNFRGHRTPSTMPIVDPGPIWSVEIARDRAKTELFAQPRPNPVQQIE